jgi:hypothetical protein
MVLFELFRSRNESSISRCREIHTVFSCGLILAQHQIDSLRELGSARLGNTTGIDSEVLYTIAGSLLRTEVYLFVAGLVPTCARIWRDHCILREAHSIIVFSMSRNSG